MFAGWVGAAATAQLGRSLARIWYGVIGYDLILVQNPLVDQPDEVSESRQVVWQLQTSSATRILFAGTIRRWIP